MRTYSSRGLARLGDIGLGLASSSSLLRSSFLGGGLFGLLRLLGFVGGLLLGRGGFLGGRFSGGSGSGLLCRARQSHESTLEMASIDAYLGSRLRSRLRSGFGSWLFLCELQGAGRTCETDASAQLSRRELGSIATWARRDATAP